MFGRHSPWSRSGLMLSPANLLSLSRIVALVPLAVLVAMGAHVAAAVVFCIAALTDFLDGRVARARGDTGLIGRIIDPIADKILAIGMLLLLASHGRLQAWGSAFAALLIIIRELAVSGLREAVPGGALGVTRLAKCKTTAQMAAIAALTVSAEFGRDADRAAAALLWVAALLTVATGIDYARKTMGALK